MQFLETECEKGADRRKTFFPIFSCNQSRRETNIKGFDTKEPACQKKKKKIVLRTEQRPAAISVLRELEMDAL